MKINLISSKTAGSKPISRFGPRSLGAAERNWTAELRVSISSQRGRIVDLDGILKQSGMNRAQMVKIIADELCASLMPVSRRAGTLEAAALRKLVTDSAGDFIDLANLSHPGDVKFVDFIINVMLEAQAKHFFDNVVHAGVVTFYSAAMGREMGCSVKDIQRMKTAGDLHDIGKIGLSAELLGKHDITSHEGKALDDHLLIGVFLLERIKWLKNVVKIVKQHHSNAVFANDQAEEPFNVLSQILRTVDIYDGLTSNRRYKGVAPCVRDFDGRTIKVFSKAEALSELIKLEGRGAVFDALCRVIEKGPEHIDNIKQLFLKREIKFVWPGIEHLIRKNIISHGGEARERSIADEWMLPRSALLWLISPKKKGFVDVFDFLAHIKAEVRFAAVLKGCEKELDAVLNSLKNPWPEYAGVVYEALFRAMAVEMRVGQDAFMKTVKLLYRRKDDFGRVRRSLDVLCLDPKRDEDAFFEWLAARLYSEDTQNLPYYGERAFVNDLRIL